MTTTTAANAPATGVPEISIYDAIGGRAALTAAVDNFYGRLLADPELAPLFPRGVGPRHRSYVVTVLGEALGGRERYQGPDLAAAHLAGTLDELGGPRDLADRIVGIVAGLRPVVVTA